jgi:hypothetical protein
LSPEQKSRALTADLVDRIRADLAAAAEQARASAEILGRLDQAGAGPDVPAMAFISVAIDRAYTALEAAFNRVAREIDAVVPTGEDWHTALLHQMTLPLQDRRPPVLAAETAAKLNHLRRHRHWLRHAYAASFSWPSMMETARLLPGAVADAAKDLETFVQLLGK